MGRIDISFLRGPRVLRFLRYAVGSAAASVVSAATLAGAYQGIGLGPRVSSSSAFCAGAVVNFLIGRFWAWRATVDPGAAAVRRDFLRYAVVAVATALVALATTTVADRWARAAGLSAAMRTLVVEGSYFGAFAVMFIAKFLILDRYVFRARDNSVRSRDQVENTTPA
jgi:putative flippase GtrA